MGVDDIHDDKQPEPVRLVDQRAQVIRSAEARRWGKEIGHLIPEGAVVGMLHDRHELQGVVALLLDHRQHILHKLPIGTDLLLLRCHPDVALVDQERLVTEGGAFAPEGEGSLGVPYDGAEEMRFRVLHHVVSPCGDAETAASLPLHEELVVRAVSECVGG